MAWHQISWDIVGPSNCFFSLISSRWAYIALRDFHIAMSKRQPFPLDSALSQWNTVISQFAEDVCHEHFGVAVVTIWGSPHSRKHHLSRSKIRKVTFPKNHGPLKPLIFCGEKSIYRKPHQQKSRSTNLLTHRQVRWTSFPQHRRRAGVRKTGHGSGKRWETGWKTMKIYGWYMDDIWIMYG